MNDRVKIEDAVVEAVAGAMWETYQYRGKWPAMASAPEQEQFRRMATAAIAALSTPTRQAGDGCERFEVYIDHDHSAGGKVQALSLRDKDGGGLRLTDGSGNGSWNTQRTFRCKFTLDELRRFNRTPQPPQGGGGEVV